MFRRIKGPQEGSLGCFCLAIATLTLVHRGLPLGAYSDLYLPWYGARALLLHRGSDVGRAPALQPDLPGALLPAEARRGTGSPRRPSMAMGWGLLAAASWSLCLPFWDTLPLAAATLLIAWRSLAAYEGA